MTAAVLLLAVITTMLLIAVIAGLLYLLRGDGADRREADISATNDVVLGGDGLTHSLAPPPATRAFQSMAFVGLGTAACLVLWAALGVSSSAGSVCESCHSDSPHVGSESIDPHSAVACTLCHEPGGVFERVIPNVPGRLAHILRGQLSEAQSDSSYGSPISSRECSGCHAAGLNEITVDEQRGVLMSHQEPLEAGAECMDCHVLRGGVVSDQTIGHDPCLRCHGTTGVSADCGTCHSKEPAYAIRSDLVPAGSRAREHVPDPTCGGCHSERSCDACHGMRMPHSAAFKGIGHARLATIDIWGNGGRACQRCHYSGHNACSQCHSGSFPAHALSWRLDHQQADDAKQSCACHLTPNLIADPNRTFCDICHDPAYQVER